MKDGSFVTCVVPYAYGIFQAKQNLEVAETALHVGTTNVILTFSFNP